MGIQSGWASAQHFRLEGLPGRVWPWAIPLSTCKILFFFFRYVQAVGSHFLAERQLVSKTRGNGWLATEVFFLLKKKERNRDKLLVNFPLHLLQPASVSEKTSRASVNPFTQLKKPPIKTCFLYAALLGSIWISAPVLFPSRWKQWKCFFHCWTNGWFPPCTSESGIKVSCIHLKDPAPIPKLISIPVSSYRLFKYCALQDTL